ncbi:hypothetical protein ACWD5B_37925 [Streptomyces tanashiensis]
MSAREERQPLEPIALTEEQLDALIDVGNRALNNHYHADLCHCREWPASCVSSGSYFMGAWDTGAFGIGLGAVLSLWESMRLDATAAEPARLRAERHSTNESLSDAAEQLRVQRDRIAELEAERKKYVGVEPTIAEEMAYLGRCLDAVRDVCDAAEKQATRWENPLPVPEWVAMIRNATDGVTVNAPALPPVPQQRQAEDPHTSDLHHDYALGRDLPFIPQQVTGRCPKGHTFEDCTCGGDR